MNNRYNSIILFSVLLISNATFTQNILTGYVYEKHKEAGRVHFEPLVGASVYWKDSQKGTTTDANGKFKLTTIPETNYLIVSFVGYKSDTLRIVDGQNNIKIVLESIQVLNEVEVTARQKAEHIDKLNPIKTEIITNTGLQRLACCNLSESFENSGTVDVNYSDAVTGAKHIQMLGLAGSYTQLLGENMPLLQGLAYSYGLTYVPGTWMQSIQVSKGTSSVINGFESITGQINAEFKKPHLSDPLFLNVYANNEGRGEMNLDIAQKISENFSIMTLLHTESQLLKQDHNHDHFLDIPLSKQLNVFQRFNYEKEGKLHFQYGIKILLDDKTGGLASFNPKTDKNSQQKYGIGINTQRFELITKHGFILPRHETSIGIQIAGAYHIQDAFFGLNNYNADEKSLYANLIYHSYLFKEDQKIDLGSSFNASLLDEKMKVSNLDTLFNMNNQTVGIFAQYTYDYQKIITLMFGFRADYSLLYGMIYTPRLHFKYEINENTTLRLSGGKGTHFAYPVAENLSYMVSARKWYFLNPIKPEQAWNAGLSFSHKIKINDEKSIQIVVDAFRTEFTSQVVVDNVSHPQKVSIYELTGRSYSNSYQINLTANPIKHLDLTLIGRYNDVQQSYTSHLIQKPLVVPFKALFTVSYATRYEKWLIDITTQWNSSASLPDYSTNPNAYQIPSSAPAYTMIFVQLTRRFKQWDAYTGVENLLNYTQHHPIIAPDDPFGNYFDASMVYAPIMGRLFYIGIRYKLTKS
ncbi:MAG: TonB-dependent receptor [Bacteroidales bacterium]|nr:TonB-dependent receptor [Bacteroidales bacterium]